MSDKFKHNTGDDFFDTFDEKAKTSRSNELNNSEFYYGTSSSRRKKSTSETSRDTMSLGRSRSKSKGKSSGSKKNRSNSSAKKGRKGSSKSKGRVAASQAKSKGRVAASQAKSKGRAASSAKSKTQASAAAASAKAMEMATGKKARSNRDTSANAKTKAGKSTRSRSAGTSVATKAAKATGAAKAKVAASTKKATKKVTNTFDEYKSDLMASNATRSKQGKKRVGRRNRSRGRIIWGYIFTLGFAAVFAVGLLVGVTFMKAPSIDTDNIYAQINQRSVLYDTDGHEVDNLYFQDGNRTLVKYEDIPENLVNAVVSVEDKTFWKHHGFNFIRILGAIKESVFGGGDISGTSTVTQQLARNVYLSDIKSTRSMSRKLTEMYYTIILEKNLSKEKIMEGYLNTIYFGFNSYGAQAASQSYFSKDVEDLDLLECAALSALPTSPDTYALVQADYYNSATSLPVVKKSAGVTYLYNGKISKDRRGYALDNMLENGYITEKQYNKAKKGNLKKHIKISAATDASESSYFTDYAVQQLIQDFVEEYGVSESEAQNMIYTNGYKIYTTLDSDIQDILEEEFAKDSNYTYSYAATNAEGNLINTSTGATLLYPYSKYFDSKDRFVLQPSEYKNRKDGGITLLKNKRLNFYSTEVDGAEDISVEFKGMFINSGDGIYFIESGALAIPQEFKKFTDKGNVVISKDFFDQYPKFFKKRSNGELVVSSSNYSLKQKIRQPQAACVVMENKTGEIKAMMGGRGVTGKQLYNRAVHARQPGSSIKPIGVYGPALQLSYENEKNGKTMSLDTSDGSRWGRYITAGSVINDSRMIVNGREWPKNADGRYHGHQTFREAIQQSLNVCAVKIFQQIGPEWSVKMLKKVGITTLDEEGSVSDMNSAALALGGLTNGLTPLEECAAYATFPNKGIYKKPIFYTKVVDSNGELVFEKKAEESRAYNSGVAWIMTDVLHTVVTKGIASGAAIPNQPVGGKTGTTSDQYDIWFTGFTPQYTMSLWEGNDVNMQLASMSGATASFWSTIMTRICKDIPTGSFFDRPKNVQYINGEYYTKGTYARVSKGKKKTKSTKTKETTKKKTTKPSTNKPKPTTIEPSSQEPEPSTVIVTYWICDDCGAEYSSHPDECANCGGSSFHSEDRAETQ